MAISASSVSSAMAGAAGGVATGESGLGSGGEGVGIMESMAWWVEMLMEGGVLSVEVEVEVVVFMSLQCNARLS